MKLFHINISKPETNAPLLRFLLVTIFLLYVKKHVNTEKKKEMKKNV